MKSHEMDISLVSDAEASLRAAGINFDPSLLDDSISWIDTIMNFTENGVVAEVMLISKHLDKFCYYAPDGQRNSGKS